MIPIAANNQSKHTLEVLVTAECYTLLPERRTAQGDRGTYARHMIDCNRDVQRCGICDMSAPKSEQRQGKASMKIH